MPPRLFSSDQIMAALERAGFTERKTSGGHTCLARQRSDGSHAVVVVPRNKNEIPRGTFRSILDQAGLTYEEFLDLAKIRRR